MSPFETAALATLTDATRVLCAVLILGAIVCAALAVVSHYQDRDLRRPAPRSTGRPTLDARIRARR